MYDRILGRVALFDVEDPTTNEVIVKEGEEINEDLARAIEAAGIEEVEIRSVLYELTEEFVLMLWKKLSNRKTCSKR